MNDINSRIVTYVKDNPLFGYEEQSRETLDTRFEQGSRIIAEFSVSKKSYEMKITRLRNSTRIAVRNKLEKTLVHGKESFELYRQVKEKMIKEIKRQTNVKDI
jgi:hypothetical protein